MKIILLLTLFSLQVFARPEVAIPGSVEVSQRELLRLSDIALVNEGSSELNSFLQTIVIREDARDLLLSQHLTSQEILEKIKAAMAADVKMKSLNPAFKIPSQVKVGFSTTPVSHLEIERKIQNNLKARCHACEYKITIQSTPIPTNKNWELDFNQLNPRGGFLLPLHDGSQGQIKWISGTIRVSQLTPVTSRLILQGERVQPADLQLVMTDTTFAKDGALRLEDVQGQIAARTLSVGSPVWATDLKREPAAAKGQTLKAMLSDEGFEISVNVQAEENGFVGDLIKVKNPDTKKILSGLVIEKGVVKLQ